MDSNPSNGLKCSCIHCGCRIEFAPAQAGTKIPCPHCGKETPLFSLSISFDLPPAASPPRPPPARAPAPAEDPLSSLARYASGEEVRLGDRVRFQETLARVVFVSDGTDCQCATGYEDYRGYDAGILICDDNGGTDFLGADDARVQLVGHRDP
jgi:hypothetical protein